MLGSQVFFEGILEIERNPISICVPPSISDTVFIAGAPLLFDSRLDNPIIQEKAPLPTKNQAAKDILKEPPRIVIMPCYKP